MPQNILVGARDRRWRLIRGGAIWLSVFVAAALVLYAARYFGYPKYQDWQAARAVRLAKSFLAAGDPRSAALSLQTALRHRPDNLEAHTVAATLFEVSGSPEALVHRRRLMELQPGRVEPKLEFARLALRLKNPEEAEKALNAIEGPDHKSSEFLTLQAELFLSSGRADKAVGNYQEALALHPADKEAGVKLAILELQMRPEQQRASAREVLESLASDGEFGLIVLRALARDAFARQDLPAALEWSKRASELPSAQFSDQMLRLQSLFSARSPDYESYLAELERRALEDPRLAFELGKWELAALGPLKASAWLESTPKSMKDAPLIGVLMADCYSALNRWEDLESLVRWANWREIESLRLGFLARAQTKQDNIQKSERTWQLALAAAGRQPAQLAPLLAMARSDKRDDREVLWLIAEKNPRQLWARQELYETYWKERNADQMLRMMELILKENPSDLAAKYNVAGLLMVTERQIERATRLAKELYEADPRSLTYAALHAYGLKLQGAPQEGAKILDSREDLNQLGNDGSAYYALILSACGRNDEARRFAAAIDRQELLPELREALDRVFGSVPASNTVNSAPF
ncbi:MAG: tetratricopeptide repeat protein [Terrimicrobiaceae bacterium]